MRHILLIAAVLLAAAASLAADGDDAPDVSWVGADGKSYTRTYFLCDGDHTAAAACSEIDLKTIFDDNRGLGPPETIQFGIYRQSANCTPTVTVYGRFAPTATGGATQVDHEVVALLGTGTSSFSPAVPSLFRVYYATVSTDADCTDLEVVMLLHYKK